MHCEKIKIKKITKVDANRTLRIDCESVSRTSGFKGTLSGKGIVFSTDISSDKGYGKQTLSWFIAGIENGGIWTLEIEDCVGTDETGSMRRMENVTKKFGARG